MEYSHQWNRGLMHFRFWENILLGTFCTHCPLTYFVHVAPERADRTSVVIESRLDVSPRRTMYSPSIVSASPRFTCRALLAFRLPPLSW